MCLFSLSWYPCGFSAQCHAAGGPSGVPLLADSGWLLYSCGCGSHGVAGCLVTVALFPPVFFFVPALLPLRGSAPLTVWIGMSSPVCWSTLMFSWWGLAATFSAVPVCCFPCYRYVGIFGLLLLRFAGVVEALLPVSGSSC